MCILTSVQICFEPESQEESEAFSRDFCWQQLYVPMGTHILTCPNPSLLFMPSALFTGCFHLFYGAYSGEGNGTPLQYSCLENPMDGRTAVHGVAESWTRLSDFTFTFHFHALEKEMTTHSSVLAWRIPGTAEPGGLLSMGSHRVGHD